MIVVAVWKEAGFFMIFYLAALQQIAPSLAEAAALEGASRWQYFRRVLFPLLMPTTLFVLINALINSVRMVDHIFVMTRGGPDSASTLLLYYIYQVGFSFLDTGYAAARHDEDVVDHAHRIDQRVDQHEEGRRHQQREQHAAEVLPARGPFERGRFGERRRDLLQRRQV